LGVKGQKLKFRMNCNFAVFKPKIVQSSKRNRRRNKANLKDKKKRGKAL
jgi:hypothetical protein